jgi:hypothetical protein
MTLLRTKAIPFLYSGTILLNTTTLSPSAHFAQSVILLPNDTRQVSFSPFFIYTCLFTRSGQLFPLHLKHKIIFLSISHLLLLVANEQYALAGLQLLMIGTLHISNRAKYTTVFDCFILVIFCAYSFIGFSATPFYAFFAAIFIKFCSLINAIKVSREMIGCRVGML